MIQAKKTGKESGERDALARLYHRHGAGIFRFLRSLTGDDEHAAELCQEAFLSALPALREGRELGSAFLYRCARNAALSRLRKRGSERRWLTLAGDEPGAPGKPLELPGPDRELERRELRAALDAALADLPEPLRAVFLLVEVEGLSYLDTAEALEVAPGTVASRKHKALKMLRENLRRSGHAL